MHCTGSNFPQFLRRLPGQCGQQPKQPSQKMRIYYFSVVSERFRQKDLVWENVRNLENLVIFYEFISVVVLDDGKSYSDGMVTETDDEGFYASPTKSTTNVGWLVGSPSNPHMEKNRHIDIYETGQVKPPPYLNVKEVQQPRNSGYNLCRSKSVCDLSIDHNNRVYQSSEKSFTIERKQVMERKPEQQPHRSRVVRNRTILGSFPLFYKLSQSLSSLNTKSEASQCDSFYRDKTQPER